MVALFKPCSTSGAVIRLTFYCEPCKRIAHLVDSLDAIREKRGILGIVIQTGKIEVGDIADIKPNYFSALSEIPYERFLTFLNQIPEGKVVTYKQVFKCIGVDKSYFRVFPLYLKKTPANYPKHRVLDSQGRIIAHIPQQKELLEAEGIEVISHDTSTNKQFLVSLERYLWKDPKIYDNHL